MTALTQKKAESTADKTAVKDFINAEYQRAWYNANAGVHLVNKGDQIVPDKGYLKGLEYPLRQWIKDTKVIKSTISELDAYLKHARSIQFHGPIAGFKTGQTVKCNGISWLVTSSAIPVDPVAGTWPHLQRLVETLLPCDIARLAFYSWLNVQMNAIRTGRHSACPMLILAGDANDGKTFLLTLITLLRGGREINPIQAWAGDGPCWTDHLIGAECLNIDDSVSFKDYRSRQNLATKFKEAIYGSTITIDKRNHTSFTLSPRPVWGVCMVANANGNAIKVLPALDGDDMKDKAIVLRTHRAEIHLRDTGDNGAELRLKTYTDELPHFLHWLLNDFAIPAELPEGCAKDRAGLVIYRDPAAMTLLHRESPAGLLEEVLYEIAQSHGQFTVGKNNTETFTTAELVNWCKIWFDRDRRIPDSMVSTGQYFSQIANRPDGPIEDAGVNRTGSKLWRFRPQLELKN